MEQNIMTPKELRNELLGHRLVKQFTQRHYNAFYYSTAKEAIEKITEMIPEGSSVTWGGSMTIRDMGLTAALAKRNLEIWHRDKAPNRNAAQEIYRKAFDADYYITSANAVSEDGLIVNIDGNGNRVAAITFGPKNVIFVIGLNKVAQNIDAALARARSLAAPINMARFDALDTPCKHDGVCHNCKSVDSICNYIHIMRNSHPAGRHTVVLVGEDLGY